MLRYYLTQIAPETKDSEFTWKGFQDAVNSELVAVFGNFVNRTFVLMHKLCKGKVPPLHSQILDDTDKELISRIEQSPKNIQSLIEEYKFRDALFEVIDLSRKGNQFMQKKEPWIKAKQLTAEGFIDSSAQKEIDNCLHLCLQLCANISILLNPFLPNTSKKMLHLMKVVDLLLNWENAGKLTLLKTGYSLRAPELLFRKIEDEEISWQLEKLKSTILNSKKMKEEQQPVEQVATKPTIQFDDFTKLDLRVATVIACEKVEKADKLLKLTVDLGSETRTIVSGIAQHYKPEELIGKQVVVVTNLAARKMKGIESQGMILTAEDKDGKLRLLKPEENVSPGSLVS